MPEDRQRKRQRERGRWPLSQDDRRLEAEALARRGRRYLDDADAAMEKAKVAGRRGDTAGAENHLTEAQRLEAEARLCLQSIVTLMVEAAIGTDLERKRKDPE